MTPRVLTAGRSLPPITTTLINDAGNLLRGQFPRESKYTHRYLAWRYCTNPVSGPAFAEVRDGAGALIGFGAMSVTEWARAAEAPTRVGVVMDIAAHPVARQGPIMMNAIVGAFPAAIEAGITWGFGIPNDNSLMSMGSMFGAVEHGTLPVTALRWAPPRRSSRSVDASRLTGREIGEWLAAVDQSAGRGWRSVWNEATLSWRLRSPHRSFALHHDDHSAAISTTLASRMGPVALIVKAWPRVGVQRPGLARIAGKVAAFYRSPLVIHVGHNENVLVAGRQVPSRFLPAPLHTLVLDLGALGGNTDVFRPGTMELLDFDAV